MYSYLKIVLLLFFITSFLSCQTPLDKKYDPLTYNDDIEAIRESNKVSDEDVELLVKYIAVSRLAGNELNGKSYADILDKIKTIQKANGDEKDRAKMQQEAKRERLSPFLKVNLTDKQFERVSNMQYLTYFISFQNTSAKHIKIIIGNISMSDILDREIKKIDIIMDEVIKAGSSTTLKKRYNYNAGSDADNRIRSKELKDLRIEWNPDKIVFEDGTIAE